jgi:Flp pilus assembly protein TadD/mono/diheme cytochrome c family protein
MGQPTHAATRQESAPAATQSAVAANSGETWSRDVAPVLYNRCATCHHPGGAGPFSLLTYADVRRWAPQILYVTQSRFMPPWLPEPGYGDFADSRRLSDAEVALLKRWINSGMAQGDPKDAPPLPHYDAVWQMGKPDLVLEVPRPVALPAGGTDVFLNLLMPYPLKETRYIRAMEILPSPASVVHHANVFIDRTAGLRRKHPDAWQDGIPGMDLLMDAGNRFDPDSHFLFWKPDTPVLVEPDGMPWRLDPGNDLGINIHLKPSGKAEMVSVRVGLYFTGDPPVHQPMLLQLAGDDQLNIPAGDPDFVVEDSLTLPVDVEVLGVYPHTHYLGHDMKGWAILPNGEKKWLVWIKDWDINRQSVYRYRVPLLLPQGTVLHMKYSFDNSEDNPHNPHNPPVRVHAGNRSEDEMSHLWLQVLPVSMAPNSPDPRLLLEEAWMRNRVSKSPADKVSLYNLAAALAGQNKFAEAARFFERELLLEPGNARTLTALGAALEGAGQTQQAIERYKAAIEDALPRDSSGCDARFDLANLEVRSGSYEQAEKDFRGTLAACPEDAEIRSGLGTALLAAGRAEEAEREFNRALELDPGDLTALYNLGAAAADSGDAEQAVKLLEAALRAGPPTADTHEKLAMAFAQLGRLNDALIHLRAAATLTPEDPVVHGLLAQVLGSLGHSAEAIDEQNRALQLDASDADGWNNLGVLQARNGQVTAALGDFEHALRLKPDHAQAKANLAHFAGQN